MTFPKIIPNNNFNNIYEKDVKIFKNLSCIRIISMTIYGIKKKKVLKSITKDINTFRSNKTSVTNKSKKKYESSKILDLNKSLRSMKVKNNLSSSPVSTKELKYSPIVKKNNMEIINNQNLNKKNDDLMKSKSFIRGENRRLSKIILSTSIPKFDFDNNIDKEKDKDKEKEKDTIKNKIKGMAKIRVSKTLNTNHINMLDKNNNNQESVNKNINKNKKKIL